ncbi:class I SAM-dependent methyltransferase [Pendulispora brunnea]|uniref:S-adenosyl-L-methionine-dependent methyltransferase n=1 Tax=Pendulispora brunnea TaxID=2905690 RepID=A0ABZ2K1T9_9BACT
MQEKQSSTTALGAAVLRALHQDLDRPPVFDDPLAMRITGEEERAAFSAQSPIPLTPDSPVVANMRGFLAARSRYAEDALAVAVARGTRQYVVLGAGFDTFGYRNPHTALRVFEVDYPATQVRKRELLAKAGIAIPPSLVYVPIDFEKETLDGALARAGLIRTEPVFFSWLGVTAYLTRDAVMGTLQFMSTMAKGSEVVLDYMLDPQRFDADSRAHFDKTAPRFRAVGEAFLSFFDPEPFAAEVKSLGFSGVESIESGALREKYFRNRTDGLGVSSFGALLHARV